MRPACLVVALAAATLVVLAAASRAEEPVAPAPAAARARAVQPRAWDLPRDHRSHPEFALEWWYLTGHLATASGRRLGYQATFFRTSLGPGAAPSARTSPLAARDAIMWHGSVTDLDAGIFAADEVIARAAAGWASASDERLGVVVHGRSLREVAPDRWELRARSGEWTLALDYALDRPPVLHGAQPGLSRKGPEPGQSSYYVSRPHLRTSGVVTSPSGERLEVTGLSWFDQEFGSGQLADDQVGWDWFSVNLDDGSALMIYLLRERAGGVSPTSSGTFVRPDGTFEHLPLAEVVVRATATWTSPRTRATYPSAWRIEVPRLGLALDARASVAAQERGGEGSAAPAYWEGACRFQGTREGRPLAGEGYAELVGYAGDVLMR